jgi:hypothetical protein
MTDDLDARRAALAARRARTPATRGHAATGGRLLATGLSTGAALVFAGLMARVPAPTATAPATAPAPQVAQVATDAAAVSTPADAPTPHASPAPSSAAAPVVTAAPTPAPPATTSRAS